MSDEVPFEQRLLDAYNQTPRNRKGLFLRQLLELGMAALDAQQAGISRIAPAVRDLSPAPMENKVASIARSPAAPAPPAPASSGQPEVGSDGEGDEIAVPIKAAGVLKDFFTTGKSSKN
ncbi:hypothetical protein [Paucibacter soli]|uniref:hypothetical protein n=1 Tax=Paucibacter soli TaxID=3133433 RepID=UPI0030988ADA